MNTRTIERRKTSSSHSKPWGVNNPGRLRIGADARRGLFRLSRNRKKTVSRVLGELVSNALAEEDLARQIPRRLQVSASLALRDYEVVGDCSQVKSFALERFVRRLGRLTPEELLGVRKAVGLCIGV